MSNLLKLDPANLLHNLLATATSNAVETLLAKIPIADVNTYNFDPEDPSSGWQAGLYHWLPVGRDRGNGGRVRLAGKPIYPLAERLVNGMEALIEMMRLRELLASPGGPPPATPREAVLRYFKLPPLDEIPNSQESLNGKSLREQAREFARRLQLHLKFDKKEKEFAISIRDNGVGQTPGRMHRTLLSLGSSDKGDKPYLIGVFGQGGSSTYAASRYSWVVSRRAPDLLGGLEDGIGWTIVRQVIPKGRRDPYFAYLAAHPDGRVPSYPVAIADELAFSHGSHFCHIGYDFGSSASAITRNLYQALNHVLYNPVLPFDTDVAGTKATVYGNGYRLSNLADDRKDLDKNFGPQSIEKL